MTDISIITATHKRPKDLWKLMECVRMQDILDTGVTVEHIVAVDGARQNKAAIQAVEHFPQTPHVTRLLLDNLPHTGEFGAGCKDAALKFATGRHVVFWDDDNWFYPHALSTLHKLAVESTKPIVLAPIRHNEFAYRSIPSVALLKKHAQQYKLGNIDTGCLMVKTHIAQTGLWHDKKGKGTDHRYFTRITKNIPHESIPFTETVIGVHL